MQEDTFNINNVAIRLPIDQQGLSLLRHDYSVEYRRGEVDPAYYLSDHPAKHGAETSQLQKVAEEYLYHLTTTSTESIFLSRVEGRGFQVEGEGSMSRVEGNLFFFQNFFFLEKVTIDALKK